MVLRRVNMTLPDWCIAELKRIGCGNTSKGCRILAHKNVKIEAKVGRKQKSNAHKGAF